MTLVEKAVSVEMHRSTSPTERSLPRTVETTAALAALQALRVKRLATAALHSAEKSHHNQMRTHQHQPAESASWRDAYLPGSLPTKVKTNTAATYASHEHMFFLVLKIAFANRHWYVRILGQDE